MRSGQEEGAVNRHDERKQSQNKAAFLPVNGNLMGSKLKTCKLLECNTFHVYSWWIKYKLSK